MKIPPVSGRPKSQGWERDLDLGVSDGGGWL